MRRGEQRDDQPKKREEIHSYRRDGGRIKGIDGEGIKGEMKRRFEKDGGARECAE